MPVISPCDLESRLRTIAETDEGYAKLIKRSTPVQDFFQTRSLAVMVCTRAELQCGTALSIAATKWWGWWIEVIDHLMGKEFTWVWTESGLTLQLGDF